MRLADEILRYECTENHFHLDSVKNKDNISMNKTLHKKMKFSIKDYFSK